jgi:uncharacterized protein with PIN domain
MDASALIAIDNEEAEALMLAETLLGLGGS